MRSKKKKVAAEAIFVMSDAPLSSCFFVFLFSQTGYVCAEFTPKAEDAIELKMGEAAAASEVGGRPQS